MAYENSNILVLASDTYEINSYFREPLKFDQQNYDYYLNLLNVRFSNVVPNITKNYSFSFKINIEGSLQTIDSLWPSGIYELTDLVDLFNKNKDINGKMTLKMNNNTGKIKLTCDNNIYIPLGGGGLLESEIFGFVLRTDDQHYDSNTQSWYIPAGLSVDGIKVPLISKFNYFLLCSDALQPCSYITDAKSSTLDTTTTIYSFSSAMNAFEYKDFTNVSERGLSFKLGMDYLQAIDFKLKGSDGSNLQLIEGSVSDFNICCNIIKVKKI